MRNPTMDNVIIDRNSIKKGLAIVILAFADYESLELALASHAKFSVNMGIPIFILQNGRGTYDTERTYSVGVRYQKLFPDSIKVITHIPAQRPYKALQQLFEDKIFSKYNYIIKLDDDVMVLTEDWINKLIDCYINSFIKDGDKLAYVTSLVNNNPYGFKKIIDNCEDLASEYYSYLARPHCIGLSPNDNYNPYRLVSKDTIYGGGFGTIWQLPYVARWLHEKTTLRPEYYIEITKGLKTEEVNSRERYSINCMLFRKDLWTAISDGNTDDEQMLHEYCLLKRKTIYADLSIPMVHIAFYSQRSEIRDMIPLIKSVYTEFLSLHFPISLCQDRLIEIENRLRFIESNGNNNNIYYEFESMKNSFSFRIGRAITWFPRKVRGLLRKCKQFLHV